MTNSRAFRFAAAFGFLAVALGAFGAHGLKAILVQNNTLDVWETAVLYHFMHALMLLFLAARQPWPKGPWISFAVGIVIFSGTLYTLALTNLRWLGAITPIGGFAFLVGWAWLMLKPPLGDLRK
jgi:uncharacterized membrane protein YgdD (TMEM256/DUF423 family)